MKAPGLAVAVACALGALAGAGSAVAGSSCHEHSYVVGYQHCSSFGRWSRDSDEFTHHIEWGWLRHDFNSRPFSIPGGVDGTPAGSLSNGVLARYITDGRFVYGGLEADFTELDTVPQFTGLPPGSQAMVAGLFVIGLHASVLSRLAFGVELAAGGRYGSFSYYGNERSCDAEANQGAGELEARVRADLFVSPHISFGFGYGHSLVDTYDHMFGIYFGVHFRAVDGMY